MKAIVFRHPGPPSALQIENAVDPSPSEFEVVVQNDFIGLNYGDVIRRQRGVEGLTPAQCYIPGFEGCGRVVAVGANVGNRRVGDRVAYLTRQGAYAEQTAVPSRYTVQIDNDIQPQMAAASMCTGLTAYELIRQADLVPGKPVLVHGGAGGVSAMVLQMLRIQACKVLTVVSSAGKAEYAKQSGADVVIRGDREDFAARVLDETNGCGVSAVFDCVGQTVVEGNAMCLAERGKWLYYGSTSGHATFPGMFVLAKSLHVSGLVIFDALRSEVAWQAAAMAVVAGLRTRQLSPRVHQFAVQDIRCAHRCLEERQLVGKAVIDMRGIADLAHLSPQD